MSRSAANVSTPAPNRAAVLWFCWLGWVFDFYDLILFSFCKRTIASDLGLDPTSSVAWIEGASLFATAVGGFAFGRWADRRGRRPALVLSIVVYSLGALLTGLATGPWTLLLARCLTGLGVGGEWGIGHAVVADHWSGPARDRAHAVLQAGSPVGMALAAAMAFFVAPLPAVGWRVVFCGSAALGLLALWARRALPGPDRAVAGQPPLPAKLLWAPAHRRSSALLLTILALHMAGFWCVYAELPAALIARHGVTAGEVGWFQLQVNSVHVVADLGFGVLAARFGRRPVFAACCLLFAAGHLLVLQQLDHATADFAAFTVAAMAMGLGAGTWSCFGALFGEQFPPALRATAAATSYALARSVQLPLKPALASTMHEGSFAPALWLGAACAALSALLVFALPRRTTALPTPS